MGRYNPQEVDSGYVLVSQRIVSYIRRVIKHGGAVLKKQYKIVTIVNLNLLEMKMLMLEVLLSE